MPMTRPPRSCAPRLAASITPEYPPVQIVKPPSASSSPTRNASEYSGSPSRHFDPPKMVTILSLMLLSRFSVFVPLWLEIGVHQPLDRPNHRRNGFSHVRKVDVLQIVAGSMIVCVQTIARDGVRDDSLAREYVIVRAAEEVF